MSYLILFSLLTAGTIMTALWMFLFCRYRRGFNQVITYLADKKFMMSEVFFIGFGLIDLAGINLNTERGKKREKIISELYGKRYAAFYRYCILGQQLTYVLTFLPPVLFIGAVASDGVLILIMILAVALITLYPDIEINNAAMRKREDIISDYPAVLSKLTLMTEAGLVIREAWNKVAYFSDRPLYKEMQITTEEMKNGMSDIEALYNFAQRCSVKEIRKFSSIMSQNILKGGRELTDSMKSMTYESWEEKKQRAKIKGETAGARLMIPLMIMFCGILLMVVVPMFKQMF